MNHIFLKYSYENDYIQNIANDVTVKNIILD